MVAAGSSESKRQLLERVAALEQEAASLRAAVEAEGSSPEDGSNLMQARAYSAPAHLHRGGANILPSADGMLLHGTAAAMNGLWSHAWQSQRRLPRLAFLQSHHLGPPEAWGRGSHSSMSAQRPEAEESRAVLDWFLVIYWGLVVVLLLLFVLVLKPLIWPDEPALDLWGECIGRGQEEEDEDDHSPRRETLSRTTSHIMDKIDSDKDERISKDEFAAAVAKLFDEEGVEDIFQGLAEKTLTHPKEVQLPDNMWSLNVVASIGQAKSGSNEISGYFTAAVTMTMTFLQIATLFLVVHDIDPHAPPLTIEPSDPWIESGWTVNLMKWLMVTFMCILMITEAGECRTTSTCILEMNSQRLRMSRWLLMFVCFFQYVIMLFVIWGGVAAVLSFQSVPDILYSSMAITYISKVDEAFFVMLCQLLDVEANFLVIHGKKVASISPHELWDRLDSDKDDTITKSELHAFEEHMYQIAHDPSRKQQKISHLTHMFLHFLAVFPPLLGFALIGRAMTTNVMPTDRFHDIKDLLMGFR